MSSSSPGARFPLAGRLATAPDVRQLDTGRTLVRLRLESGGQLLDVGAFGLVAEKVAQHLAAGAHVTIGVRLTVKRHPGQRVPECSFVAEWIRTGTAPMDPPRTCNPSSR